MVFFIYPVLQSFWYSFTNWDGVASSYSFVGFSNFKTVLTSRQILTILRNTGLLMITYIPVLNIVALAMALVIKGCTRRAGNFFKVIIFFPNILAKVVVAQIWKTMLDTNYGLVNLALTSLGVGHKIDWLGSAATALPLVAAATVWFASGYYMVIYYAGLLNIPTELYEASSIDGASAVQNFRYITFPLLMPSLAINVVLSTIGSLAMFDIPYAMTNGGPGYASTTIALQIYLYNSQMLQLSNGVALSVLLCIVSICFALIELRYFAKREVH
jgi:ABC-type sugar transport system permease subunit